MLEYCGGVAEAQAREELAGSGGVRSGSSSSSSRRQWGGTVKGGDIAIGAGVVGMGSQRRDEHSPTTGLVDGEGSAAGQRVVDERLDPYSARDYTDETAGERIARVVREEKTVEAIVRARSWGVVRDRCGGSVDDWEDGMRRWEGEMNRIAARGQQVNTEVETPAQANAGGWKFWS